MTQNKHVNLLLEVLGCFVSAAGIYSFEAALKRPVSLPAVRAIRILDVEIPLNK